MEPRSGRARVTLPGLPEVRRAPKEPWELPFKLLVVGDFTQRDDPRPLEDRKPINVDRDNFDKVMSEHKLALSFTAEGKPAKVAGEAGGVTLLFRRLADMEAGAIAQQAPALAGRVDEILRDPRLQRLAEAWRELQRTTRGIDFRANVKLELLHCSTEDFLEDFDDSPEIRKSGLYKILYSGEYGGPGGRPYGAVLFRDAFRAGVANISLLRKILKSAARAQAPAIIRPTAELATWDVLFSVRANEEGGHYLGFGAPEIVAPVLSESFARTGFGGGVGGIEPLFWVGTRVANALMVHHRYAIGKLKTAAEAEAFHNAWLATLAADPDDGARPFRAARIHVTPADGGTFPFTLTLDAYGDGASPSGPVRIQGQLDNE